MGKFDFFEGVIQGRKVRIEHQLNIARSRKLKALFEGSQEKNKEDREVGEEEKKKKRAKLKALFERSQSQMHLRRLAISWCRWQKWHSQVTAAKAG